MPPMIDDVEAKVRKQAEIDREIERSIARDRRRRRRLVVALSGALVVVVAVLLVGIQGKNTFEPSSRTNEIALVA